MCESFSKSPMRGGSTGFKAFSKQLFVCSWILRDSIDRKRFKRNSVQWWIGISSAALHRFNPTFKMADYDQEQEMEIEALQAILMDDIKEVEPSESGLNVEGRCFQITLSPKDDDEDEPTSMPVRLALTFSHTAKYPDEPPILGLKSLRGMKSGDLALLKEKLEQEAMENLGMAMIYTLVTSAKEWLREMYGHDADLENGEVEDASKDDIIVPHGEAVTVETFLAWRERFEVEKALERAKLLPDSALTAPKEKKLTGRQWFESGRATATKGGKPVIEDLEEDEEEDIDFDEDFEDDEEDMLEHYLTEKSQISSESSSLNSSFHK